MWFVCSARPWADRAEQLGGASGGAGEMCEDRGRQDGDGCCGSLGSSSVAVVIWGAPDGGVGGPAWAAL